MANKTAVKLVNKDWARVRQSASKDINKQIRANTIGDFSKFLPINHQRVGAKTSHDHLWLMLLRHCSYVIVVNFSVIVYAVLLRIK